jgi:hypothetical protein
MFTAAAARSSTLNYNQATASETNSSFNNFPRSTIQTNPKSITTTSKKPSGNNSNLIHMNPRGIPRFWGNDLANVAVYYLFTLSPPQQWSNAE